MSTDRSELDNRVVTINCRGGDYPRAIFGSCDGCGVLIVADALREILALAGWKVGDPRIEVEVRADLGWNTGTEEQVKRNPYKLVSARQVLGLNVPYFKHLTDDVRDQLSVVINELACCADPDEQCVLAIEAYVNSQGISRTLNPRQWEEAYEATRRIARDIRLATIGQMLAEAIRAFRPGIMAYLQAELTELDIEAALLEAEEDAKQARNMQGVFDRIMPTSEPEPEKPDNGEIPLPEGWPTEQEDGVEIELGEATDLAEPTESDPEEQRVGVAVEAAVELHDGVEDPGRKTVKRGNGNGSEAEPA